jgi:hypothetical protein
MESLEDMTMRLGVAAVLSVWVLITGPLRAQESPAVPVPPPSVQPAPPADDGRYRFFRMQETIVRLDNQTGRVAECRHGSGGWTCQAAPEERAALEAEIGRLQSEIATLKKEWLARGHDLPGAASPNVPRPPEPVPPVAKAPEKAPDKDSALKLPSDADIERITAFLEKVWKRMIEMMANVQREMQRKAPEKI